MSTPAFKGINGMIENTNMKLTTGGPNQGSGSSGSLNGSKSGDDEEAEGRPSA